MAIYDLALLGTPTAPQVQQLEEDLRRLLKPSGLDLGQEVSWSVAPSQFRPSQRHAAAVLFMGGDNAPADGLAELLVQGIPIIPVASTESRFSQEIPSLLQRFNGLSYSAHGSQRCATALLECAGLLPRQRRVFVSYRRQESRNVALQLFDAFSARMFDVFLDTHGIPPSEDFQATLWHRLCDSDVLVMIDTPGYFDSRWTSAEFGRALAKNIAVLRVGWPGCAKSPRALVSGSVELTEEDFEPSKALICEEAIDRICFELESQRSQSIAVRQLNLMSHIRLGLQTIGGRVDGVGIGKGIYARLASGTPVVAYTIVGYPTSHSLHEATIHCHDAAPAVIYDHVGLHEDYVEHLNWLNSHIPSVRLVKACEAAWDFAGWEV